MRVIYRYEIPGVEVLENEGLFTLELPLGAELLHVAAQERAPHAPCIWALVDPERESFKRRFLMAGTGQPNAALSGGKFQNYVGTFQQIGYVWHIWEVPT